MPTTSNFGWTTPADTDLVKDGALAIRTLGNGIDTSFIDLKGGTTGQLLSKTSNADLDFTWTTPTTPVQFSPNLAINGAFIINQRGYASGANLASGSYGFDRWKSNYTNTALTYTAGINSTTLTISASGGLQQIVERENVPAGSYTLSWSGTATGRVYNSGASAPSYAASPVSFTADGTANVVIEFTASGATKTLSLVKFERGTTATTYSLAGNSFSGELAACQRYYVRFNDSTNSRANIGTAIPYSTTNALALVYLPVTMRVAPTAIEWANLETSDVWAANQTLTTVTLASTYASNKTLGLDIAFGGSYTNYRPYFLRQANNTAGYLGVIAEL